MMPGYSKLISEKGATLLELVILIIIIGVALPSLLGIMGFMATHHVKNEILLRCVELADSRLERILGYKMQNWDWYKTISQFQETEQLEGGYTRETQITYVDEWGAAEVEAYEVTVWVYHSKLPDGYQLTVRLTKYH